MSETLIIPADIRELVYLDEVQFLISENHRSHPRVQSFYKRVVEQEGREPDFVPLPELKQRLDSGSADITKSQNQQKVIELFRQARDVGASDIHLRIGESGVTRVLMRIHGELTHIDSLEEKEGKELASTIVLSMCDQAEKQFNEHRQQDGRLASRFLDGLQLFGARYAHIPAVFGLFVVMRLIPDDGHAPPTADELGYLPEQQRLIASMLSQPQGQIILSGPTGSGKSTTLRSFSARYMEITHDTRCVVTFEDPPEGKIPGAVQTAIVADRSSPEAVSEAWVSAMRAGLRLDPDCLLVGEVRCDNSARTATAAAHTGHLVLTTVHANDPFNILERLATFGVDPDLIADPQLMTGLISQRLVQRLCPACALTLDEVADSLTEDERALVARCDREAVRFRHPEGCPQCRQSIRNRFVSCGVKGRTVIAEVVQPDAHLLTIYREQGRLTARRYWHRELGGITRLQHLMQLINAGEVDPRMGNSVCPLNEDEVFL